MSGTAWRAGARVLAVLAVVVALAAGSQGTEFLPLEEVTTRAPSDEMLFFPLDESFARCVPVRAACPEDSSSLMIVPLGRRVLVWSPEGVDLPSIPIDDLTVRAIGSPPPQPDGARYLVPVLDGAGIELRHAARRLAGGRLVAGDAGGGDSVTPRLEGPLLSTTPASRDVPERIVERPVIVKRSELEDGAAVLLVRRAAPSRVVFGIAPDDAWDVADPYIPILDEDVVAVAAQHNGRAGLAVPARPTTKPGSAPDADADDDDSAGGSEDGGGSGSDASGSSGSSGDGDDAANGAPVAVVAGAVIAAAVTAMVLVRRRRAGARRK